MGRTVVPGERPARKLGGMGFGGQPMRPSRMDRLKGDARRVVSAVSKMLERLTSLGGHRGTGNDDPRAI
jgi:hypothetical protein